MQTVTRGVPVTMLLCWRDLLGSALISLSWGKSDQREEIQRRGSSAARSLFRKMRNAVRVRVGGRTSMWCHTTHVFSTSGVTSGLAGTRPCRGREADRTPQAGRRRLSRSRGGRPTSVAKRAVSGRSSAQAHLLEDRPQEGRERLRVGLREHAGPVRRVDELRGAPDVRRHLPEPRRRALPSGIKRATGERLPEREREAEQDRSARSRSLRDAPAAAPP